jgi:hypothetical protein
MTKRIKNTTGSDITVVSAGITIPAGSIITLQPSEYLVWSSDDVIAEVLADITAGNLVVNAYDHVSGTDYDLPTAVEIDVQRAIDFLRYPDYAFNIRFLSDPERVNGFVSKNVQEAIEEARTGIAPISPTTTTDNVPTVAYIATLDDDTTYFFDAYVVARRLDTTDDNGTFQQHIRVRREGGGAATLLGNTFQKLAMRTDSAMALEWDVSGNDVRLKVVGVNGKTIKWQPQVEFEKVS